METVIHNNVHYYIDFAHTPDGLDKTLSYLSQVKKDGRLILLTGAMGERDRFKRPMMGKLADQYADIIVLADEDPGDEPRFQIIQEVKDGIARHDGDRLYIIPDRQLAIKFITEITQPGDVVLLAGK
jgi:UDP-N-acetylmuramoyl-L-alanyl-D-glutamate--2,6-diaminopimelate ligase